MINEEVITKCSIELSINKLPRRGPSLSNNIGVRPSNEGGSFLYKS